MIEPITATVPQFCRLSGLGKTKVFSLIKDGTLESIKLGQNRLIVLASYRRLIEAGSKDGYKDGSEIFDQQTQSNFGENGRDKKVTTYTKY